MIAWVWLSKLFLAHLLTDFVFQSGKWIENRNARHFQSPYLYFHGLLTGIFALLFLGLNYWLYAIVISVSHIVIDGWKSYQPRKLSYFLIDQLLHVLVMLACWYHAFFSWHELVLYWTYLTTSFNFWVILTGFVFLSQPSSIAIGLMTKRWSDQLPNSQGLTNAGKWIGILERSLILIFLLQNQFAAIGLLITAKGLLRFSEKDRQEEKTEYVLIGSLTSVLISLVTGIIVKQLIG